MGKPDFSTIQKGVFLMLVRDRMSSPCLTIGPETPVQEALAQMHKDKVRRYPVVDKRGHLLGVVSMSDLLNATPSDATLLSVWEVNYLLSKLTVEKVMTKDVITITEDTPIEEAARIMADHKIGGLPVVRGEEVVGIITETNLFKAFLELLGARYPGLRVSVLVEDTPGKLNALTGAIYKAGGDIIALGTFAGDSTATSKLTFKLDNVNREAIEAAISPLVVRILDIREVKIV